jgi:hypothetical protein
MLDILTGDSSSHLLNDAVCSSGIGAVVNGAAMSLLPDVHQPEDSSAQSRRQPF